MTFGTLFLIRDSDPAGRNEGVDLDYRQWCTYYASGFNGYYFPPIFHSRRMSGGSLWDCIAGMREGMILSVTTFLSRNVDHHVQSLHASPGQSYRARPQPG